MVVLPAYLISDAFVLDSKSLEMCIRDRAVAGFHTESPAMMLYRSEQSLSQISDVYKRQAVPSETVTLR